MTDMYNVYSQLQLVADKRKAASSKDECNCEQIIPKHDDTLDK